MTVTPPKITTRDQLVHALTYAAELEHLLCCNYLFATVSIRRTVEDFPAGTDPDQARVVLDATRPWLWNMFTIARQEMEHLGIVQNLLAAVGAVPYFDRPGFPQPRGLLPLPIPLWRFDRETLRLFIIYEKPDYLTELPFHPPEVAAPATAARSASRDLNIHSIQELYQALLDAFCTTLPPQDVFVGNPERQVPSSTFGYKVSLATVTNRDEARAAITQVVQEGEGIGLVPMNSASHFQRYSAILADFEKREPGKDGWLDPAFPVVSNPWVGPIQPGQLVNPITASPAVELMSLFNEAHTFMLRLLVPFFGTYSASRVPPASEQLALNYSAFFPLMTMVVRPLAELIVRTPAGDDYPGKHAGPSFQINGPVSVPVSPDWARDELLRLAKEARALSERLKNPVDAHRLCFIADNLTATAGHTHQIWKQGT